MGVFLDSYLFESFILVITSVLLLYLRFKWGNARFWSRRNISHLPPRFIIGNKMNMGFTESTGEVMAELYRENKEKRVFGFWQLNKPQLVVFDLDIIQNILVRDFSSFQDRFELAMIDEDPLAGNLFNLSGQPWRNMRVKVAPTFTSGKMKGMFPIMLQNGKELQKFLLELPTDEIDVKDVLSRFTIDIIASCAFGIETNSLKNPDNDFRKYGLRVLSPTLWETISMTFGFLIPFVRTFFKLKLVPTDVTEFFIGAVKQTMEYRKLNGVKRNDFLQLLIQLKEKGKIEDVDKSDKALHDNIGAVSDTKFTLNEAVAQAFVFFLAGFETSATTMTYALYELAKNPDIQKRLKEEVNRVLEKEGGALNYDSLSKMNYLDWTVQETLRKYPVVPVLERKTNKEYYLKDFDCWLPKDQQIHIPLFGITRDPDIFSEPDKFDPTRFSPEEVEKRHHFSSIPFGEGPRNCIGSRFGLLQTKVGLVSILQKFTVEPSSRTPENIDQYDPKAFILTIEGGLLLKLRKESS